MYLLYIERGEQKYDAMYMDIPLLLLFANYSKELLAPSRRD